MNLFDDVSRIAKENKYKVLLEQNVLLSKKTTFKIGGAALVGAYPENAAEFSEALSLAEKSALPVYVLGRGSNLLISDEGFVGMVIFTEKMNKTEIFENGVFSDAGVNITYLSRLCGQNGLSGLEFACGIPGSVGGAVAMNAGAYGGEISQVFDSCVVYRRGVGVLECTKNDADFAYRHTSFLEKGDFVLCARFALNPDDPAKILEREEELLFRRRDKQPLEFGSAGSTFKRPEGHFAGKLIEDAGLKGLRVGDAMVSEKHAGFIINAGSATAEDVLSLMKTVRQRVFDRFGVMLEPEVRYLGTRGEESI